MREAIFKKHIFDVYLKESTNFLKMAKMSQWVVLYIMSYRSRQMACNFTTILPHVDFTTIHCKPKLVLTPIPFSS